MLQHQILMMILLKSVTSKIQMVIIITEEWLPYREHGKTIVIVPALLRQIGVTLEMEVSKVMSDMSNTNPLVRQVEAVVGAVLPRPLQETLAAMQIVIVKLCIMNPDGAREAENSAPCFL